MAEGDVYVNCSEFNSVEALIRLLCVTDDCSTPFITCDNAELSLEYLLRLLVREDASGNPALAVCGCSGGGGATTEQATASVTSGVAYSPTFGTAFSDTSYSLLINIYGAGGASVGFTLDSKTAAGFTITPSANGTINWAAIKV